MRLILSILVHCSNGCHGVHKDASTAGLADTDSVSPTQTKSDARDVQLRFIRTYKELPVLWDVASKEIKIKLMTSCFERY